MITSQQKAVSNYRLRLKRGGIVRLELHVRTEDASLLRGVVAALADPGRETEIRSILREHVLVGGGQGLKALLAAAPFDGIDLERARDIGRPTEL